MVNIIFWNCGVAPLPSIFPTDTQQNELLGFIDFFLNDMSADIIILTEANDNLVKGLRQKRKSLKMAKLTGKAASNSNFDMLVITSEKISITSKNYIKANSTHIEESKIDSDSDYNPSRGRTMKIGVNITFKHNSIPDVFNIIASHWSSRKIGFNEQNRRESADKLKVVVKNMVKINKQVILIGDYNDPPNADSIIHHLGATNNRHYASIDKLRIYNPSNSFLAPHSPYKNGESQHFHGTWLSKDSSTRNNYNLSCQVFDQVMYASSFISSGPWHFNEEDTKTVYNNKIIQSLYSGRIDHLPIMTKIEHHP